jgi:hypothetical protein
MLTLPARSGEKPKTNYGLPHEQLNQNPPPEIYQNLKNRAFDLPFVERRPSIISVPGAEALWLQKEEGHGCAEAFMRGNEFAHVHPSYDGSMHMMLPGDLVSEVLEQGWGESHPLVPRGQAPISLVMIFGPRDKMELEVTMSLIGESYRFARGS